MADLNTLALMNAQLKKQRARDSLQDLATYATQTGYSPEDPRVKLAREMSHRPQNPASTQSILDALAIGSTPIPIVGDIAGLAADANMYKTQPESRTAGNFALSSLGLLPFVPGVAGVTGKVFRGRTVPLDAPNPSSAVWTTTSPNYAGFYATGQGKTPFDYVPSDVLAANTSSADIERMRESFAQLTENATKASEAYSEARKNSRLGSFYDIDPNELYEWADTMGLDMTPEIRREVENLQKLHDESLLASNTYNETLQNWMSARDQGGYIEPLNIEYNKPYVAKDEFEAFTESEEWFDKLREEGYDSIVWSPNDDLTGLNPDEIQKVLDEAGKRPYGPEIISLYPEKQLTPRYGGLLNGN